MSKSTPETPLTERQQDVYNTIVAFMNENKYPPTRAELADIMGLSSANGIQCHLEAIEKKGWVELLPGTGRGIRLLRDEGGSQVVSQEDAKTLAKAVVGGALVTETLDDHNLSFMQTSYQRCVFCGADNMESAKNDKTVKPVQHESDCAYHVAKKALGETEGIISTMRIKGH